MNSKEFLFRLLLAADIELIISDLNSYRLFVQYWLLIRNDPDALISAFPTIMIATGLNVRESLLSITMINRLLYLRQVIVALWLNFKNVEIVHNIS